MKLRPGKNDLATTHQELANEADRVVSQKAS